MVKRSLFFCLVLMCGFILLPLVSSASNIWPVVSPSWLEDNLKEPGLVVIDVRKVEDYKAGHIPGAVNVFYGSWVTTKAGLRNELPPVDDLTDLVGSSGIDMDSSVVIVGKTDTMADRVDVTRVAWTLKYLGLENVSILDGGYNRWVNENREVSTEPVKPKAKNFKPNVKKDLFVDKNYVKSRLGNAVIVDTRDAEFFKGEKKLDFVAKEGRIKGAVNLPSSSVFRPDGNIKIMPELGKMADSILGTDVTKEVIFYCDTGRLATVWAYISSQLLGYKNVKVYDGSSEEWMKDPDLPVEK
ncbi:MAG: sulfurtransferase [Syntrophorhabdaceae bacterium]|nr:sulfurtransferase [Syntrophorhabdaceae bacterium]